MNSKNRTLALLAALPAAALLASCVQPEKASTAANPPVQSPQVQAPAPPAPAKPTLATPALDAAQPAAQPGLHNLVTYAPGLFEGSVPEGDEGFASLQAMGVKTVISVDGAAPDLATAKAHGMKYIHLPVGYGGVSEQRTLEIAKAVQVAQQENPGAPVYVHCHHGKHRAAGALGAAAVTLGQSTPEEALSRMKVSGTAPNYTGLYKCVQVATPATTAQLAAVSANFPEVYKSTGLVQSMVEIDEVFDHLKEIEKAGWKAPADHPDLVPVAEAGRLADLFRNLRDDATVKSKPVEFGHWLLADSKNVEVLEGYLAKGGATTEQMSKQFKLIATSCKECHVKYRD